MQRGRLTRAGGAALFMLVLSGCAGKSGVALTAPPGADVAYAYIPLSHSYFWVAEADAGGVALGNGIAVTAAHADAMVPRSKVIGISTDYDLMFFHTDRTKRTFDFAAPTMGDRVVSYAHYDEDLYKAEGVVTSLDAPVKARCSTCVVQSTFSFDGNAGPGYSGGPVLDAKTGRLVGIVFGYLDKPDGGRTIYAYPMSRVLEELKKIEGEAAATRPASSP